MQYTVLLTLIYQYFFEKLPFSGINHDYEMNITSIKLVIFYINRTIISLEMKKRIYKIYYITAVVLVFALPGIAQDNQLRYGSTTGDNVDCGVHLSGYREFLKIDLYDLAREPWSHAFDKCPESGVRMYVDGVKLYRSFIEKAPEGPIKEGLIDTLLLIYDRRMEYFGDEGNVLGRKGKDLLAYRGTDIEQVQKAYEMLERSIEIEGSKSQESVVLLFLRAAIALNKQDKLDQLELIDNYVMLSEMLAQLEKKSSRWKRTRATINEMVLEQGRLSCKALDQYYDTKLEVNKQDKNYLETMISLFEAASCSQSDAYLAASESLYLVDPDSESAHSLGILLISRKDYKKAIEYLDEAVQGDNINPETKAKWYYELALVSLALEENCKSISYARQAVSLRENFSKAYILLGDAFIASRANLGDDFQKRTAYWAAADQYRKAVEADPSLEAETRQKLEDSLEQYPNSEDVFFRDLRQGDTYLVGGCINVNTTVRAEP